MQLPKKGDKLYIPTSLYIDRGEDDVAGGLATIKSTTKFSDDCIFVEVEEVTRHSYNWQYLMANQKEWAIEYAGRIARDDPDYN